MFHSQISEFTERLSSVLRKFIQTIGNLNLEKGSSQLDDAKTAYREGRKFALPGKFNQAFNKLQRKIVKCEIFNLFFPIFFFKEGDTLKTGKIRSVLCSRFTISSAEIQEYLTLYILLWVIYS